MGSSASTVVQRSRKGSVVLCGREGLFVWLVFCVLVLEFHNLACNNVDLMHSFAFKNLNNFAFKKQLSI